MFVALRGGVAAKSYSGIAKELCKIGTKQNVLKCQSASLMRASMRNEDQIPNIKPFPYHNKTYDILTMILEPRKCRVHEHSKLIVVDGPVASGKNQLAKELAKEFDFLYLPQLNFDDLLITNWGFDIRQLDCKLPKDAQSWDIERFLQCPNDVNTISMQMYMYTLRQYNYMTALAHILCTGQGVVTIRSPWSDRVFAKAMAQSKYISPGALEYHTDCCLASLHHYLKPHLIIYLDVPVDVTQRNIKKRGLRHEVNSKVLNEKYLSDIEENYKRDYLSKLSKHSLLLIYDWSQGGDVEVVVEDIENLNFVYSDIDDKLEDWKSIPLHHKVHIRHYTYEKITYLNNMDIFKTDVPEMLMSGNDLRVWDEVINSIDDMQYAEGYNFLKGDKNIFWKTKIILEKDYVTPLMKKYYERKQNLKARK